MVGIGPTEFLFVLGFLLVVAVVLLKIFRGSRRGSGSTDAERDARDARQVLDERYARGDLGRDEYRQMRRDIEG